MFILIWLIFLDPFDINLKIQKRKLKKLKTKHSEIMSKIKTLVPFYAFFVSKCSSIKNNGLSIPINKIPFDSIKNKNTPESKYVLCYETGDFYIGVPITINHVNKTFNIDLTVVLNLNKNSNGSNNLEYRDKHSQYKMIGVSMLNYIVSNQNSYCIVDKKINICFEPPIEKYTCSLDFDSKISIKFDSLNKTKLYNLIDFLSKKAIAAEDKDLAKGFDAVNSHFYNSSPESGSKLIMKKNHEISRIKPYSFKVIVDGQFKLKSNTFNARVIYKNLTEKSELSEENANSLSKILLEYLAFNYNHHLNYISVHLNNMFAALTNYNNVRSRNLHSVIINNLLGDTNKTKKLIDYLIVLIVNCKDEAFNMDYFIHAIEESKLISQDDFCYRMFNKQDIVDYNKLSINKLNDKSITDFKANFVSNENYCSFLTYFIFNSIVRAINQGSVERKKGYGYLEFIIDYMIIHDIYNPVIAELFRNSMKEEKNKELLMDFILGRFNGNFLTYFQRLFLNPESKKIKTSSSGSLESLRSAFQNINEVVMNKYLMDKRSQRQTRPYDGRYHNSDRVEFVSLNDVAERIRPIVAEQTTGGDHTNW